MTLKVTGNNGEDTCVSGQVAMTVAERWIEEKADTLGGKVEIVYGKLIGIPNAMLQEVWPIVEPMVNKVLVRNDMLDYFIADDIFDTIKRQDMQLWVVVEDDEICAAIVTQIIHYPRGKVFDLFLVGGDKMESWVEEAWGILKAYGRSHGCRYVRGFGRKGWTRVLGERPNYHVLWDVKL